MPPATKHRHLFSSHGHTKGTAMPPEDPESRRQLLLIRSSVGTALSQLEDAANHASAYGDPDIAQTIDEALRIVQRADLQAETAVLRMMQEGTTD